MDQNILNTNITDYLNSLERCAIAYFEIKERRRQRWAAKGVESRYETLA